MYVQIQPLATCSLFCCPSHIPNVVPDFPKMSWIMCHNHSKASLTIHEKTNHRTTQAQRPDWMSAFKFWSQDIYPWRKCKMRKAYTWSCKWSRHLWLSERIAWQIDYPNTKLAKTSTSPQPPTTMPSWGMVCVVTQHHPRQPRPTAQAWELKHPKIGLLHWPIEQSHGMLQTTRILASCFCLSRISFKARVIQQSFNGHPLKNFQKSLGEDPSWEFLRLEQSLCKNETGFWSMDSRDKDLQTKMC